MRDIKHPKKLRSLTWLLAATLTAAGSMMARAQPTTQNAATATVGLKQHSGVWIEGPGFDIKYGGDYETCASRCIANKKCVMIEYYRPEKKCNQYDAPRKLLQGGSSIVGTKQ